MMNRARKSLKQQNFRLKECQSVVRVTSLRGSNQIEMMDAKRRNLLALFPASFPKRFWIGRAVTKLKRRRRRSRRERGRGGDMCEIPPELVLEILTRLPEKSLTRFKCVSKQWTSLISCRYFCSHVFTVARRQQPRLYMSLVAKGGQRVLLSMSSTSLDNTCFVVDQDLSIPGMGGFFLNVVRGLMCFSVGKKARIYNPSTKQILTLPAIKSGIIAEQGQKKHTRCYMGHDPVNDQYSILCTIAISSADLANLKSEHWVFVLEAGGLWKKVAPLENYRPHAPVTLGWSISGLVVHYMAWLDMYTCAVVSFDIRSQELNIIPVPAEVGDVPLPAVMMKGDLIQYGGKIAVFDHSYLKDEGLVDLWVFEDAGKKKWSKRTWVLKSCQRHLVHDTELIVKGSTQDGKIILAPSEMHSEFYILFYDMQNNYLRRVEIKGIPHFWFDNECYFDLKFVDESESFVYLTT